MIDHIYIYFNDFDREGPGGPDVYILLELRFQYVPDIGNIANKLS